LIGITLAYNASSPVFGVAWWRGESSRLRRRNQKGACVAIEYTDEYKMDCLGNMLNDAIGMPWMLWREGQEPETMWREFSLNQGTWFDTPLYPIDPMVAGLDLMDQLEGLTLAELMGVAKLMHLSPPRRPVCCRGSGADEC
jgi:hypothetical protein